MCTIRVQTGRYPSGFDSIERNIVSYYLELTFPSLDLLDLEGRLNEIQEEEEKNGIKGSK